MPTCHRRRKMPTLFACACVSCCRGLVFAKELQIVGLRQLLFGSQKLNGEIMLRIQFQLIA